MLGRLLRILLILGAGYLAWRAWRIWQAKRLPSLPDRWRTLAASDATMSQGLDLWDRLAGLSRRLGGQRELMLGVHGALDAVAGLVAHRLELEAHLAALEADEVPPAQADRHAEATASVRQRVATLHGEARRAIDDLRQIYLDLLGAYEESVEGGRDHVQRTREAVGSIRGRIAAEREIREIERE